MTTLADAIEAVTRIGVDTAPLIYWVEEHPRYLPHLAPVFQRIADLQLVGLTSVLTLTEVLVQPIRLSKPDLQAKYTACLLHSASFEVWPITAASAQRAAELRARYNLRTPDALQLATTLMAGGQAFLTNDVALKRVTDLRVLVLDEFA